MRDACAPAKPAWTEFAAMSVRSHTYARLARHSSAKSLRSTVAMLPWKYLFTNNPVVEFTTEGVLPHFLKSGALPEPVAWFCGVEALDRLACASCLTG